ncbi:MAG TPA: protein translocase subunit SecF [Candidatus Merdivicinus faecavium]|nr:protein translocase subunit SecF [Candidatus Merdivicinus faecavium]
MFQMKQIDFYGHRKIYYTISACLIALLVICVAVFGVKVDIQFTGGLIATYSYEGDLDFAAVEQTASEVTGYGVTSDSSESLSSGEKQIALNFSTKDGLSVEMEDALTSTLEETYADNNLQYVSIDSVAANMGTDFLVKCLVAVFAAFILMIVYIAIRFRRIGGWSAGVTGVIALLHDALMVFAVFVIFRLPVDDNFMAVVLFILGYSINDTIVIFDRIRENERLYGRSKDVVELVNLSINQTLRRTMNTTLSTLIAMGCVCVFAVVFGVSSIISFAFPMVVGLISGFYSSVCLSGTIWAWWRSRDGKGRKVRAKK